MRIWGPWNGPRCSRRLRGSQASQEWREPTGGRTSDGKLSGMDPIVRDRGSPVVRRRDRIGVIRETDARHPLG